MFLLRAIMGRFGSYRVERLVALHFRATDRTARLAVPLIEKLLTDDKIGETYRCYAIIHWGRSKHPPLERFQGNTSLYRVNGPLQDHSGGGPGWYSLPAGGLVESPGITACLDPHDASELADVLRDAIDTAIVEWLSARDKAEPRPSFGVTDTQPGGSDHD
jgi:hypothetical protein